MTPLPQHPTDRKDLAPRLTPLALIYLPVLMVMAGVVRFAVRAGIIRFEPMSPEPQFVSGLFNNRYFRRAQASCIRRELTRIRIAKQPITGLKYFPRRYAFMGFEHMPSSAETFKQYLDQCIRQFGLSRTVLFGLSSASYIVAALKALLSRLGLSSEALAHAIGRSALSLAAPADPAPP